mmetsp:Transcript_54820/g.90944  ORF Transcript_54820/g.90944 Transcript_54820/m.90944 type:complete len:326 (-) Transcript_54820:183-1160(-)
MAPFPSTFELKCAGCSLIVAQILTCSAFVLHSLDYDVYDVHSEEQVIELHNILSSDVHRAEIEAAAACFWVAFPFSLIALYGIRKFTMAIFGGTFAELFIYIAEKSYLVFIMVLYIILPALSLVSVSYEWSFHEYTGSTEVVATGYYMQLYTMTLMLELLDCMAIADATFMLCLFLLPRYILLNSSPKTGVKKFIEFRRIITPECCKQRTYTKCCLELFTIFFVLSLLVVFCIVLFGFGESGFFSPSGKSRFLIVYSFVMKVFIGARMVWLATSKHKYHQLKRVFEESDVDAGMQKGLTSTAPAHFQMDSINPAQPHDTAAHDDL